MAGSFVCGGWWRRFGFGESRATPSVQPESFDAERSTKDDRRGIELDATISLNCRGASDGSGRGLRQRRSAGSVPSRMGHGGRCSRTQCCRRRER